MKDSEAWGRVRKILEERDELFICNAIDYQLNSYVDEESSENVVEASFEQKDRMKEELFNVFAPTRNERIPIWKCDDINGTESLQVRLEAADIMKTIAEFKEKYVGEFLRDEDEEKQEYWLTEE